MLLLNGLVGLLMDKQMFLNGFVAVFGCALSPKKTNSNSFVHINNFT